MTEQSASLRRLRAFRFLVGCAFFLCSAAGAAPLYLGVSLAAANISPDVTVMSRGNDRASILRRIHQTEGACRAGLLRSGPGRGGRMESAIRSCRRVLGGSGTWGFACLPGTGLPACIPTTPERISIRPFSSTDATGADFDKISNELATGEEDPGRRPIA